MGVKTLLKPCFQLTYAGHDITADIAKVAASVEYKDRQGGMADEASVEIVDPSGIWRDRIVPHGGEIFTLRMGYAGMPMLMSGNFEVDEPEYSKTGVTLKGASTSIAKSLRTKNVQRYRDATLSKIVNAVAARNGYTVNGRIPALSFKVRNQDMSDLEFLQSLADDFGCFLKVYDNVILFTADTDIEQGAPVMTLSWRDLMDPRFMLNENKVYRSVEVSYQHKGALITATATDTGITTENTLKLRKRCENQAQAQAIADAILRRSTRELLTGSFDIPGSVDAVAGNNIVIENAGELSGTYQIKESTHKQAGAYRTRCEVYRVTA